MSSVWHALADPWTQPILLRAFAEVALLGLTGGALGCWIVFYNLSYSAESLAHSLLPGLVAAALLGLPLLVGGAAGVLIAAIAVALAGRVKGVGPGTGVAGGVTPPFGPCGVLFLSPPPPPGVPSPPFGDLLRVSQHRPSHAPR